MSFGLILQLQPTLIPVSSVWFNQNLFKYCTVARMCSVNAQDFHDYEWSNRIQFYEQSQLSRDGILWHQFKKRLESFASCYSQSPFWYWRIFKENHTPLMVLLILTKIRQTRKLESIHEYHFVERKNKGRKLDNNSSLRRLEIMPRNLD